MFDIKYRVLTRNVKYNSRSADSVHYVPSFTTPIQDSVAFVLHNLVRKSKDYVFLDAGCGGGKALIAGLSSSEANFRHFFGIEYDSDLAALARKNLLKISPDELQWTVLHADARNVHELLEGNENLVVFMYNPFKGEVLEEFLANLRSFEHIILIYVEPEQHQVILDNGFRLRFENIGKTFLPQNYCIYTND